MESLSGAHARADTRVSRSIFFPEEGLEALVEGSNELARDALELDIQIFLGHVHLDVGSRRFQVLL